MIYVDNAATTKVSQAAIDAMMPFLSDSYGNPSSSHRLGMDASKALKDARNSILEHLGAQNGRIIFTSCGSEANNQAILTAAEYGKYHRKRRIIISEIEHDSVYNTAKRLEEFGFEVVCVGVDKDGVVCLDEIESAIDNDTALVSIMTANNEIGTIQPIKRIGEICRRRSVLFHTDAVQAVGHLPIDVEALCVDMLSFSAHKFGGVKGVGGLYVRDGIAPSGLIIGGAQESGARAGTENIAGIVSMAAALEESSNNYRYKDLGSLRDRLIERLISSPRVRLNGRATGRLNGNVNISVNGISSELMLMMLDAAGICASSGAACHSAEGTPSRVLKAIGLSDEAAMSSVRFSLSYDNTEEEIDYIADTVEQILNNNPLTR